MKLEQAELMARGLMKKHGVSYKFQFMPRRQRFNRTGQCNWSKKIISLQPAFVELNELKIVKNTILHEIAHALKPKHGHNKFWKAQAVAIGCTGLRCYGKEVIQKPQSERNGV